MHQRDNGTVGSDALRADLEQTRERLLADVDAIEAKLSPENLKAEAKQAVSRTFERGKEQVRETAAVAGAGVSSFVRENPVPLALIGIGLGWLVWNSRRARTRGHDYARFGRSEVYDDLREDGDGANAEHALTHIKGRVHEGIEDVRRAAADKARQAKDKVSELEGAARDRAQQARTLAVRTLDEQPLLLGAVALGAGLAVGLSIPSTESENQLVGQYRDRLMASAKSRIGELSEVAEQATDTA